MRIGERIFVLYDARPIIPSVKAYLCEVTKLTKTGFKMKNLDEPDEYEDVIFCPDGSARGWDTLSWMDTYDLQAKSDYDVLRERMNLASAIET